MSAAVASMPSPHQLPLRSSEIARSSPPTKGYKPPTAHAERSCAEGTRSSPSKIHREEPRGAYRAQSIRAIQEVHGDVDSFLEELETKRRQLDEQIQRYIKQKDREFKLFERDARIKYRNAGTAKKARQPVRASLGASLSAVNGNTVTGGEDSVFEYGGAGKQDALQARSQPRIADNGLMDTKVTREREADLRGVFTPTFLSSLSQKLDIDRPPSAPASLPAPRVPSAMASSPTPLDRALHRANSDPVDVKDAKQTRIKLEKRTSSSGSEGKNLVSVLKSPAAQARGPKRKRVSLVVGDDIVAPSDSLNAIPNLPDDQIEHAEHVERIDYATNRNSPQITEQPLEEEESENTSAKSALTARLNAENTVERQPQVIPLIRRNQRPSMGGIASALASERKTSPTSPPLPLPNQKPNKPELDVFMFSDIELGSEDHPTQPASDLEDIDISPPATPGPSESVLAQPPQPTPPRTLPRAEIPVRPGASRLRTSSSSSSQPVSPGFSRPSVKDDPVFPLGEDVKTPEIEQNEVYGSFRASLSLRAGSLGESFMERNAEELRRNGGRRRGSRELQTGN